MSSSSFDWSEDVENEFPYEHPEIFNIDEENEDVEEDEGFVEKDDNFDKMINHQIYLNQIEDKIKSLIQGIETDDVETISDDLDGQFQKSKINGLQYADLVEIEYSIS
jgi:hypothetical protein